MKQRHRLSVFYIVSLLLLVGNITVIDLSSAIQGDFGPDFRGIGNRFTDYSPSIDVANGQLLLTIDVRDSDGIDTVIGIYKMSSKSSWSNLTLELNHTYSDGWEAHLRYGPNFVLTPDNTTAVWNVKYYANDTFGNWNVTDEMNYSFHLVVWQEPPPNPFLLIGSVIGIAGIVFVVLVAWQKRRN